VDEENTPEVVQSILNLLIAPERRLNLGKAARAWVIKHHNWDGVASQYRDLVR
jgi:glycosyltransferase involved in cell wall biosynthesis